MSKSVPIILDFDGVLHSYRMGWTGVVPVEPPVQGSKQFCFWLIAHGYDPIVSSTRATNTRGRIEVEHWLARHGYPTMEVTGEKRAGVLYVDDNGFRFSGDFNSLRRFLEAHPEGTSWVDSLSEGP